MIEALRIAALSELPGQREYRFQWLACEQAWMGFLQDAVETVDELPPGPAAIRALIGIAHAAHKSTQKGVEKSTA